MSENQRKHDAGLLFAGLLLLLLLFAGFVFVASFATVSGSASLPNGANLTIQARGGFGVSETAEETRISYNDNEIRFTKTEIWVDGTRVGLLDSDVQLWQLKEDEQGAPVLSSETKTISLAP